MWIHACARLCCDTNIPQNVEISGVISEIHLTKMWELIKKKKRVEIILTSKIFQLVCNAVNLHLVHIRSDFGKTPFLMYSIWWIKIKQRCIYWVCIYQYSYVGNSLISVGWVSVLSAVFTLAVVWGVGCVVWWCEMWRLPGAAHLHQPAGDRLITQHLNPTHKHPTLTYNQHLNLQSTPQPTPTINTSTLHTNTQP